MAVQNANCRSCRACSCEVLLTNGAEVRGILAMAFKPHSNVTVAKILCYSAAIFCRKLENSVRYNVHSLASFE